MYSEGRLQEPPQETDWERAPAARVRLRALMADSYHPLSLGAELLLAQAKREGESGFDWLGAYRLLATVERNRRSRELLDELVDAGLIDACADSVHLLRASLAAEATWRDLAERDELHDALQDLLLRRPSADTEPILDAV